MESFTGEGTFKSRLKEKKGGVKGIPNGKALPVPRHGVNGSKTLWKLQSGQECGWGMGKG